jgi:hypothetical protein
MYLETISCGARWKSTYFVDVTTFFNIEPSIFMFTLWVGNVVLNSKEARGLVSTNLKFQEWQMNHYLSLGWV